MRTYLLAIDQGTSSTRALIYDEKGLIVSQAQCEITQYYPQSGWVEHDPEEIWQKTLKACQQVLNKAKLTAVQIHACGITNQRETTVVWNKKTGKTYHRALVWQDRRTHQVCDNLIKAGLESTISKKTGLLLDPYFSATKLQWLFQQLPELANDANNDEVAFGTIDSFLLWRLTKGKSHLTDITNASRTMLFNIVEKKWDDELLEIFNIPSQILPETKACNALFGVVAPSYLGAAIPITGIAGDQQAAVIGQGCFQAAEMKATYGTGGFLLVNTGNALIHSQNRLLSTILYQINDDLAYGLEGSILNTGTTIKWLRDQLKVIEQPKQTADLAHSVTDNGGVYMVPAFTGLGAPYWAPQARGAILGLRPETQLGHIVRAALEAVAYQTKALVDCIEKDYHHPIRSLKADGGMSTNDWLLQFIADLLAKPIYRSKSTEATARGVIYLAGLGAGVYQSLAEISSLYQSQQCFTSEKNVKKMLTMYTAWQEAVKRVV